MKTCLICSKDIANASSLEFILSFKRFNESAACHECLSQFTLLEGKKICTTCSKITASIECSDCKSWNDGLINQSMFQYNAMMRAFFKSYKFQGDYALRLVFRERFVNFIKNSIKENEQIVPIPIDEDTMKARGFNQVTGLIEGLDFLNVLSNQRTENSKHQFQRNREERLSHVNTFKAIDNHAIDGQNVLLVDDIYTTGTTIRQAADVLKKQGVRTVRSITLCR